MVIEILKAFIPLGVMVGVFFVIHSIIQIWWWASRTDGWVKCLSREVVPDVERLKARVKQLEQLLDSLEYEPEQEPAVVRPVRQLLLKRGKKGD